MTEQLLVKAKANNKVQAHVLGFIQADDKARPLTSTRPDTNNYSTGGSWLGTPLCLTTNTNGSTWPLTNTHMSLQAATYEHTHAPTNRRPTC